jgi:hypothetical protein
METFLLALLGVAVVAVGTAFGQFGLAWVVSYGARRERKAALSRLKEFEAQVQRGEIDVPSFLRFEDDDDETPLPSSIDNSDIEEAIQASFERKS